MIKPLVAIVGKPNVGKSTFFNKVCGERISIVADLPGVTRDRIYGDAEWCGHKFTLVDTGGIQLKSEDSMFKHIKQQAEIAVDLADVILFFADYKTGLTMDDYDVATLMRKTNKPVLLVINKVDHFMESDWSDFYSLGFELFPIAAEQKQGVGDLLDRVIEFFPEGYMDEPEDDTIKIAVVGKPNAGKSSLTNKILGYDRTIVSDVAGTTRDAIDTPFEYNGKKYVIIDTAGMRRKRAIEDDSVEQYSVMRSLNAVRRADVCLIVMDANEGLSEQDVKIAGFIHEEGKPSVVVVNKWDLIEKDTNTVLKFKKQLECDLAFMDYFRYITVSALTGQRVNKLMEEINYVYAKSTFRCSTGMLNDVVADAIRAVEPPAISGRRAKIKYVTQPSTQPPTFVVFTNDAKLVHFSYRRYLENYIRRAFSLDGTPIKMVFRDGSKDEE
ncbi:MAG: ribosome biogenesis GTPase Der [Clostridia bacterium]|nr:ribosome biogenesis GTPase Der [Clostridia bacterium]MBQ3041802.1 ribosome biogenesis GTPase Der [Clostridia bacterium]MBQ4273042.1 ribosome biogenesis GTPase Der [Clostridia bacterium]MBQ9125853.1 ribosome biogenesis GTPase Der [Clostridia bacterium]MBR1954922.1 ribosome biogenesis GTPase Der [Clostridia bacterium]